MASRKVCVEIHLQKDTWRAACLTRTWTAADPQNNRAVALRVLKSDAALEEASACSPGREEPHHAVDSA